jgi:hypothetical protein
VTLARQGRRNVGVTLPRHAGLVSTVSLKIRTMTRKKKKGTHNIIAGRKVKMKTVIGNKLKCSECANIGVSGTCFLKWYGHRCKFREKEKGIAGLKRKKT